MIVWALEIRDSKTNELLTYNLYETEELARRLGERIKAEAWAANTLCSIKKQHLLEEVT